MDIAQERREALTALRKNLDLTQAEMAASLGLSMRAWNDIENGRSEARKIHTLATERAALRMAAERGKVDLVPGSIIDDLTRMADDVPSALMLAELILLRAYERVRSDDDSMRDSVTDALHQTIRAGRIARGELREGGA
ncbi:MAG: helix-turn-helix transcriptional regulator [Methylorubrum rhodinum]|uniref:helix-turn-helix domain-containing protein n=1 Tax=Methylorubrum rhodinum TaxID=29428 RepID=UPI003BAFCCFC